MIMETKALGLIVVILIVGVVIGVSLTGFASVAGPAGPTGEGQWICMQIDPDTCTQYVTGDEWIDQNCAINVTGQVNCQIPLDDGQVGIIELPKLTIPDQICVEWECVLEMWGRIVQ